VLTPAAPAPREAGKPEIEEARGEIRRTGDGLRVFAVAAGILARYREGGTLELTCPCGRISPVEEMQASALPIGSRQGGRSLWWG